MRIGNRAELDAERNALRDRFDAVWMAADSINDKERRAIRCATALDKPNHDTSGCWIMFPGGRVTHHGPIMAGTGATLESAFPVAAFGRDLAAHMAKETRQ